MDGNIREENIITGHLLAFPIIFIILYLSFSFLCFRIFIRAYIYLEKNNSIDMNDSLEIWL